MDHILQEEDTVYYIAFASEKHSKLRGPAKRHTLYHACANFAIIAMATCGINPFELEQTNSQESKNKETEKVESESKPNSCDSLSLGTCSKSLDGKSADPSLVECDGTVPEIVLVEEQSRLPSPDRPPSPIHDELDNQLKYDAIRGMKLLRFHSQPARSAGAAPVKVNLLHKDSVFHWPSPAISAGSSASNTPTPSIISSHRPRNMPDFNRQRLLLTRPGGRRTGMSHLDVPPMILAGQEQDFTTAVKYSARGAPNLSNLIEDPLLEASGNEMKDGNHVPIEPCHISITLEEDREEPLEQVPRKGTIPILPRAPWIKKQISEPNVNGSREMGLKKRLKNAPPTSSTLMPPDVPQLTRWASDGKLKKPGKQDSVRPPHLHMTQDLESDGVGMRDQSVRDERMDISMCLSDQNLLTPTSFKKHEMQSQTEPSHALFHRRSSLFKGLSRRRSSHGLDSNSHEVRSGAIICDYVPFTQIENFEAKFTQFDIY